MSDLKIKTTVIFLWFFFYQVINQFYFSHILSFYFFSLCILSGRNRPTRMEEWMKNNMCEIILSISVAFFLLLEWLMVSSDKSSELGSGHKVGQQNKTSA